MMIRAIAMVAALAAFLLPAAPAAAQAGRPSFEPAACMFDTTPGAEVECGYLTVPERHAAPEGETIRLAVAIYRSSSESPQPDPIVMLQGGPGGSTIDTYSQMLALPEGQRLLAERDVVLFDQRGTLYSEPALVCTENYDLVARTIEQDLSDDEAERLSLEAAEACRARLASEGIDLSAYDSIENAADVEALRVALGYEQINLYGVSYGTLLALHVMRDHPQGLRSVILDAVVPTHVNFVPESLRSQDRAFSELFAACAADQGCAAAYPDLERRVFALAERLDAEPARVPVTDPETGRSYRMVLDGQGLLGMIFQLLYASNILPAIPLAVERAEAGDFTFFSNVAPLFVFDRTMAYGMYYSVICAEDADFTPGEVDLSGVRPAFAENAERELGWFQEVCARWGVETLPPSVDDPVRSEIPTLVLNGRFDPITPPAFGAAAAEHLPNSTSFVFGNTAHGALLADPCPTSIALRFLRDPQGVPDGSCVSERPAPTFALPESLLPTGATSQVLTWFDGKNLWQPALLALLLLVLLAPFAVWPILWLVRVAQSRPAGPPRPGIGRARALAALTGPLALVFVVGLVAAIFAQAFDSEVLLFFGLPRWSAPLFAIPPLLALLALGLLATAALGWRAPAWSGLQRGAYTLLALAAVAFAGLLAYLGMMTPLLGAV